MEWWDRLERRIQLALLQTATIGEENFKYLLATCPDTSLETGTTCRNGKGKQTLWVGLGPDGRWTWKLLTGGNN